MAEIAYHFSQGHGPLLVSMPHVGTYLTPEVAADLNENGRLIKDTDWHLDQLYNFLADMGVSRLMAHNSRTVIDLNRDAGGAILYPGQSETELCPTTSFDNKPLYHEGYILDQAEILRRKAAYWQPYHNKIRRELDRIKAQFGYALLWDAHSIQSHVPRFFDGQLPDLNLGTGDGQSCDTKIAGELLSLAQSSDYKAVLNGRFKGGYITRHYGDPGRNIHAFQLEISQITYMDEYPDFKFREERAEKLRPLLKEVIDMFATFKPENI